MDEERGEKSIEQAMKAGQTMMSNEGQGDNRNSVMADRTKL